MWISGLVYFHNITYQQMLYRVDEQNQPWVVGYNSVGLLSTVSTHFAEQMWLEQK